MKTRYKVAVIGAGASGLMCAARLIDNGITDILLIEGNDRCAAKLLMSGNGRCNLGNTAVSVSDYHTDDIEKLRAILERYTSSDINGMLSGSLGIRLAYQHELIYPATFSSRTVYDAFINRLNDFGVDISYGHKVSKVIKREDVFVIDDKYESSFIVFACGGASYPSTGSDGSVYRIIRSLMPDASFEPVVPSLVRMKIRETDIRKLSGKRCRCTVSLRDGDVVLGTESGEMIFTDSGVSGICIMSLSGICNRYMRDHNKLLKLSADLLPDIDDVPAYVSSLTGMFPGRDLENALCGILDRELLKVLISRSGSDIVRLASMLKDMELTISGTDTFEAAQVTSGGLELKQLGCDLSFASDGRLFVTGETVNVDGRCGGFNLNWAFASAMAAADGISSKI